MFTQVQAARFNFIVDSQPNKHLHQQKNDGRRNHRVDSSQNCGRQLDSDLATDGRVAHKPGPAKRVRDKHTSKNSSDEPANAMDTEYIQRIVVAKLRL